MPEIVSPCVNVCQLDAKGETCLGCGRTREEIGAWLSMSPGQRDAVMARLEQAQRNAKEAPSSRAC